MAIPVCASMGISERLTHLLALTGLSQTRLALISGVRQTAISKICAGQLRPYWDQALALARGLGCPVSVLVDDAVPLPKSLDELRMLASVDLLVKGLPPGVAHMRLAFGSAEVTPPVVQAPAVPGLPRGSRSKRGAG